MAGTIRFTVDGLDAYSEWGCSIAKNGCCDVVKAPKPKAYAQTDWPDMDGEEVDTSELGFEPKEVRLSLVFQSTDGAARLLETLTGPEAAYHSFHFIELGKTSVLRYVSHDSLSFIRRAGAMTLVMSEDNPFIGDTVTYGEPTGMATGYRIDGTDLGEFGAFVLMGTDEEFLKAPRAKKPLTIGNRLTSGVRTDPERSRMASRDVKMRLLFNQWSVELFTSAWRRLFQYLSENRQFVLSADITGKDYTAYYKECEVSHFDIFPNDRTWCEFTLTLNLQQPTETAGASYFETEGGQLLETEPWGELIDMAGSIY